MGRSYYNVPYYSSTNEAFLRWKIRRNLIKVMNGLQENAAMENYQIFYKTVPEKVYRFESA